MAMESRPGLMEPSILDSGVRIGHMEKESLYTLMVTSTMVFGPMTKQMAWEYISMSMEHSIKVSGRMISNMEKE